MQFTAEQAKQLREQYLEYALRGDHAAAAELLAGPLRASREEDDELGMVRGLLVGLLWPTTQELAALLRERRIATAAFRSASVVQRLILRDLSVRLPVLPEEQRDRTPAALIYAGAEETEQLAGPILTSLFTADGWAARLITGPVAARLSLLGSRVRHALILCAQRPDELPAMRRLIDYLRGLPAEQTLRVICCGGIYARHEGLATELGADGFAADPGIAILAARGMVAKGPAPSPLHVARARRIQEARAASQVLKPARAADVPSLWEEYRRSRSDASRNALMEHYLPLVRYNAERIHVKLPEEVDLDDLMSEGIFGLMDAVNAYDPERGVSFETYCAPRIRGAILDGLRSMDWIPRLVRSRAHKIDAAATQLHAHLGRTPTNEEMARHLKVPVWEYERMTRDAGGVTAVESSRRGSERDQLVVRVRALDAQDEDELADKHVADPAREVARRELSSLMKGLSRAERLIIDLYYVEQMSMKEVGAVLDLSESRTSQMHSSVLQHFKAQMGNRERAEELLVGLAHLTPRAEGHFTPSRTPEIARAKPVTALESPAEHGGAPEAVAARDPGDVRTPPPPPAPPVANERERPGGSDPLDCSVFAPPQIPVGSAALVQVFLHTPDHAGEAAALAQEFDDATRRGGSQHVAVPVPHGSRIGVELALPGFTIDQPKQQIIWRGATDWVQFAVRATRRSVSEPTPVIGTAFLRLGQIPIAHVKFKVTVTPRRQDVFDNRRRNVGFDIRRYTSVFLSYASKDRAAVQTGAQILQAIGMKFFLDVLSLSPGERWKQRLYRQIDECDLFLLFWSSAAERSRWVRKEIQYARRRKGADDHAPPEICPIVTEKNPPRPPRYLRHLHFDRNLSQLPSVVKQARKRIGDRGRRGRS